MNGVTTTFTMDLNTGLTQALSDGTNHYVYGLGCIAQVNTGTEYFLGDAMGSVRLLADSSGAITYARAYDPYGVVTSTAGTSSTIYGYTGEVSGDSTQLTYLRSRYYASGTGRFLTQDTWGGDSNRPSSLNRWSYVEGNPVNYTDPSGHCIFTGVDTIACLLALAIGIPVIAGVTTAAWDFSITQDGAYGGANWSSPECIDWYQVLEAGKGGSLGALNSEGQTIASIPLTPAYIYRYLVYGDSPTEVNMDFLRLFSLDDEYRTALGNPNFYAGQAGGNTGMTYISLAMFLKGLPNFRITSTPLSTPILQPGGLFANRLILTLPGIEVIGGSGEFVYIGIAGMLPQFSMMSGNGGGGSPSSSELAQNMINDGRQRPPKSDAHHIVAGSDPRAAQARAILRREGKGINDADNGAWLPRQFHWRVHNDNYYALVNQKLVQASPGTVRNILKSLGDAIETGNFP